MGSKKNIIFYFIIITIILLNLKIYLYKVDSKNQKQINVILNVEKLYKDYNKKLPIDKLTIQDINLINNQINQIDDINKRNELEEELHNLKNYILIKEKIDYLIPDGYITSKVNIDNITQLKNEIDNLNFYQKKSLLDKYGLIKYQYDQIEKFKNELKNLFLDVELKKVKSDVTVDKINNVYKLMKKLLPIDIEEENKEYFDVLENYIVAKKEEDKKNQKKLIAMSYVKIDNIPFISQVENKVYNGCEAASLLMALQYKNVAMDYDLNKFASEMPKSDNPNEGFVNSIFSKEPRNIVHWIAPSALAKYGSNFSKTTDISASEVENIINYIDNGIPVITYITYNFDKPKNIVNGIPLNLHVVLVIGYNKITENFVIFDPWKGKIEVEKDKFKNIYDNLKYAVVVE